MNTFEKGDDFEETVFDNFKRELQEDHLFVSGKTAKIFRKKGYFSKHRKSNIITDISIESYLPGRKRYSLLIVIECKHYSKPIPVNELEEFYSKVQQIAGVNVKAIFATNAALQKGTFEFAKSTNIGIIRYLPFSKVEWLAYLTNSATQAEQQVVYESEYNVAFLEHEHTGNPEGFCACDENFYYGSMAAMLKNILK